MKLIFQQILLFCQQSRSIKCPSPNTQLPPTGQSLILRHITQTQHPTLNIWFTIWKPLTVSCYQDASPLSAISKTLLIKAASLRRESHQQSMHSGIMVLQKLGLNLFYASNYTPCINFQKTSFDLETFLRSLIIQRLPLPPATVIPTIHHNQLPQKST